jgi:hypothetical protein
MEIKKIQHIDLSNTANFFGGHKVTAGFFESAKYANGTPVAYIAAIQEFGYPEGNIPSRPFFRNAIKANGQKWGDVAGRLIESAIEGKISESQALEQLGSMIKGDIQESIIDGDFESLKQSTLVARQSRKRTAGVANKPLIDTGHMMRSVDYTVEEK